MKIQSSIPLFLAIFGSWSMFGSLALRSRNNIQNGRNGFRIKEHNIIKEEQDDRLEDDHKPVNEIRGESVLVGRVMKTIDTVNADNNARHRKLQDNCEADLATLQNCYASDLNCNTTCLIETEDILFEENNGSVTCSEYNAEICPSFATCGCESCQLDFSEYYNNCVSTTTACTFDCESIPSPTLAPTLAPTQQPICSEELAVVNACLENMDSCVTCVNDAYDAIFENADTVSCDVFEAGICPAIKTDCGCEECSDLLEEYYSCLSTNGGCPSLDCNLNATPSPTKSSPSPIQTPPSPATPEPPTPSKPNGATPRPTESKDTEVQASKDGGISVGVVIGSIAGVVVVVGVIVVAVLFSRRSGGSNSKPPEKPVLGSPMETSHDETEYNPPSTPDRQSGYGASPGSPGSPAYLNHNNAVSPNTAHPNQGILPVPKYSEPDYQADTPHTHSQPDSRENQQHRASQQYPPQQKDIPSSSYSAHSTSPSQTTPSHQYQSQETNSGSSYGANSSTASSYTTPSKQAQQQHQRPPQPTPAYLPTNKDQCRTVLRPTGGEEEILVEATPVMLVESTPAMADVHSVISNHVDTSSSNGSQSRRPALDP